jgi:hypothetical protein
MIAANLISLGFIFILINSGVLSTIKPTINKVSITYIIMVIIPVPTAPGMACTNIPRKSAITAFGDIPANAEFAEPVLLSIESILKNILPKLPNLVSNRLGPLVCDNAIVKAIPNPINIAIKSETPLPLPTSLAYAMGNEVGKIREMIELPLRHPELFKRLGIQATKGVILHIIGKGNCK